MKRKFWLEPRKENSRELDLETAFQGVSEEEKAALYFLIKTLLDNEEEKED